MNNTASAPGPVPAAANINTETGGIAVGTGSNSVDTYVDFMCPYCNQFEQAEGETIRQLIDDGSITLNVHPVSILDRVSQGTQYSTRSASAAYCVAESDPDALLDFITAMYAQQPAESSPGLTDDEIVLILSKMVKQRRDSIRLYEEGGRIDLAEQEKGEIEVIEGYLPEQLSEEDVAKIVAEIIADTGAESMRDMGKVMGQLMPKIKGRFDGKLAKGVVQSALQ